MKKFLSVFILLMSQVAWGGSSLSMAPTKPEQFQAQIDDANPMVMLIKTSSAKNMQVVKFENSISDIHKFTVSYEEKKGVSKSIEMVLVVTSVGNPVQDVKIYAPMSAGTIVPSQISPICSLRNYGDFSWESADDLKQLLRVVDANSKTNLEILVKTKDVDSAKAQWTHCGAIRHVAK